LLLCNILICIHIHHLNLCRSHNEFWRHITTDYALACWHWRKTLRSIIYNNLCYLWHIMLYSLMLTSGSFTWSWFSPPLTCIWKCFVYKLKQIKTNV
jgi:hypothetical protein